MRFIDFQTAIKTNFYPIIALQGEDAFLRKRALATLISAIDLQAPDFNSSYHDETSSFDDVFSSCEMLPFASEKRLVVVQGFNAIETNRLKQQLYLYLKNPNPTTCLVFVCDKQSDIFNIDGITCVDCNKLEKQLVVKWICATVKNAGKQISPKDADLISEYCLCDMGKVSLETQKLISATCGDTISEEDIQQHVSKDIEFVVFDLTNALAERDEIKSLRILKKILTSGEDKRRLVGLIYNNFRRIFFVAITVDGNLNSLSAQLGVKEFAVKIAKKLSIKYTKLQLKKILDLIIDAERRLKVDFANENECLHTLILQILSTGVKNAGKTSF